MAASLMASQREAGSLVIVTKSAVMNTLVTPSIPRSAMPNGSSVGLAAEKVVGPPTAVPTVNLSAFGLGVESIRIGITVKLSWPRGPR